MSARAATIAFALAGIAGLLVAVGLACFVLYLAVPVPETLGWPFSGFRRERRDVRHLWGRDRRARPGNRIAWLTLGIGVGGGVILVLERVGAYLEFARGEGSGESSCPRPPRSSWSPSAFC
jgi:hypothetical protein